MGSRGFFGLSQETDEKVDEADIKVRNSQKQLLTFKGGSDKQLPEGELNDGFKRTLDRSEPKKS
jgi:hypothetical protein